MARIPSTAIDPSEFLYEGRNFFYPSWTDGQGRWFWHHYDFLSARIFDRDGDGKTWDCELWEDAGMDEEEEAVYYVQAFTLRTTRPVNPEEAHDIAWDLVQKDIGETETPPTPEGRKFLPPQEVIDPFSGDTVLWSERPDLWGWYARDRGLPLRRRGGA